jgi:ATP-dependent DNA ligase
VLIAQIKFTEWTSDNQLRQPVFLGLRTDKEAKEVVREQLLVARPKGPVHSSVKREV